MTEAATWRDVKAKARAADPMWDSTERVARRREMHEQMLSGAQLAERPGVGSAQGGGDRGGGGGDKGGD